jgi:hypothetical protein
MEKNYLPISICFGLLVFFAFLIKSILSSYGYTVKPLSLSFSEVRKLFGLAKVSIGNGKKMLFYVVGVFEILSFIGLLIGTIFFIFTGISNTCSAYRDFKNYEYNYIVVNKYIDSTQHSYPTLILRDSLGNQFSSTDLNFDRSGLFDILSIGDSIEKKTGTGLVTVSNSKLDTTIMVDFGCNEK